ncbi:MAG TPA: PqqD family protein [Longimicrobiales bacterium]
MKKNAANRLAPAKDVISTVHGTRTVLLDARNGHYWGLDEVGSRIWALAQESLTPLQIALQLSEEYDAPLDTLRDDVDRFFATLRASRLLEAS